MFVVLGQHTVHFDFFMKRHSSRENSTPKSGGQKLELKLKVCEESQIFTRLSQALYQPMQAHKKEAWLQLTHLDLHRCLF